MDIQEYGIEGASDPTKNKEEYYPLPVVNGEKVGIDFVDKCAGLACEMMKGLV